MMKRLLAILLVICMIVPTIGVFAADDAVKIKVNATGSADSKTKRWVIDTSNLPIKITQENQLKGAYLNGTVTYKGSGDYSKEVLFNNVVVLKSDVRNNGAASAIDFSIPNGAKMCLTHEEDSNYVFDITLSFKEITGSTNKDNAQDKVEEKPSEKVDDATSFEAFDLKYTAQGMQAGVYRFVISPSTVPLTVTETNLIGAKVYGELIDGAKKIDFNSTISKVEIRANDIVLVVPEPKNAPVNDYKDTTSGKYTHSFNLKVAPASAEVEKENNNETTNGGSLIPATPDPNRPDSEIAVNFNGEWMKFDVDPVIVNDRTLVPMRAIFEALGCSVSWDNDSETAIGSRNGSVVMVTIGSNDAFIGGEGVTIDQPPMLINDRTMVPLRFISEAYNCVVEWDDATQSVYIKGDDIPAVYYIDSTGFFDTGTWTVSGGVLTGLTNSDNENGGFDGKGTEPAVAEINVAKDGKYKLWVRSKDFATNKPGSRFFHVEFDGQRWPEKMGAHGKEGFYWAEAGEYDLKAGVHTVKLFDTSGFFARCNGVILADADYDVPQDEAELNKIARPYSAINELPMPTYPAHTKEDFVPVKTGAIENESTKVVFYQGQTSKGNVVQNELYTKDKATGEWILTKTRNEEFGFLMMYANESNYASGKAEISVVGTKIDINGAEVSSASNNFYKFGKGLWLIPDDFTIENNVATLHFAPNDKVNFSACYGYDELSDDIKVTINADFVKKGSYSFGLFNGDGVEYEQFDTVTAPLLYLKHALPDGPNVLTEAYLFTPMNTLHFEADNNVKTPGRALTYGLAVDPSSTSQHYAHPDTSEFGTMFYTTGGKIRSQLVAPMMGNDCSKFEAGEKYSFSYRILSRFEGWYDTLKHVAVDLYNCNDIRTNYYGSVNDSIYNIRDLIMDDDAGGWDDNWMGYYNMEAQNLVSQSNIMSVLQRYLLSEDKELLEERVVPTIAYAVSRGGAHYAPLLETNGAPGYATPGSSLSGFAGLYNAAVWGGVYEASQGRMPWLLDHALNGASVKSVTGASALYKYSGYDEKYRENIIKIADDYLASYPDSPENREKRLVNGFVYGDYTTMTATLLAAYELTGEQKYLDKAEESGRLLMGAVWTTGYQNGYDKNTIHIDSKEIVERGLNVDVAGYNFFWHGKEKWRLGNVDGEAKSAKELYNEGIYVPSEDIPGWLATKTAMGTEHAVTPGHGNVITMNNWLGTLVRLSEYTGDEWFETQARNAVIGRFQNYPGYYIDRYIASPMHADYPYVGPDMTSIYWHHIPIFLSMVEDFLVNEAWAKSNKNIDFPYVYQGGYAYFNSYQFGQAPGKFYDEDDMWLWIDKDVVTPDSINIDYVAAKKDGVMGAAFMNEDNKELTTTITLGSKVGEGINGVATVYDADGNKSETQIVDSKFTLTIPSKGIMSVVIKDLANVKTPVYVKDYTYSNQVGQTASAHTNGMGYVIQFTDDEYWAYVYISNNIKSTKSAKLTYTVNGETKTIVDDEACFEWIIKVDDPNATFTYEIEATDVAGRVSSYGGGTLKTLQAAPVEPKVTIGEKSMPEQNTALAPPAINTLKFTPVDFKYTGQGNDGSSKFRFVCKTDQFPFEATEENLVGLKFVGELVDGDVKIPFESYVTGFEARGTDQCVLIVPQTSKVKIADYLDMENGKTHKFVMKLTPQ